MQKISIILLCYNESKNLKNLINQCKMLLKKFSIEIIIVDNGSIDNTKKILKKNLKNLKKIKTVFVKKNVGYGNGIIRGLRNAKGNIIGWTHGDDLSFYYKMRTILKTNLEKKNFFLKGYRVGHRPFLDVIFSYSLNILSSILLRKTLWEITAHPTLFSKQLFTKYVKYLPKDFSIDLYLYYLAKKNNYIIKRLKFSYSKRKFGVSSWNKNFLSKLKLSFNYLLKILRLVYLSLFKI